MSENYFKYFYIILALCVTNIKMADECNKELLNSQGLHGLQAPSLISVEMCPSVQKSCCSKRDQLTMYQNWVNNKEKKTVKKHLYEVADHYTHLLRILKKVYKQAESVIDKLKHKQIANCKELAKRLLTFEIAEIMPRIRSNIKQMEDFFYESYKGFYCSLCNYENHKFFNLEKNEVIFSEKYCRDLVEHTLPNLMFFHIHINKYLNLVSKFLLSCDYKGDYQIDVPIPKAQLFVIDEKYEHELRGCRNERNTLNWFNYCKPVCNKFTLATFSPFFEPELKKLIKYTEFMEDQLKHIHKQEAKAEAHGHRILEVESKKKKKSKKTRKLVHDADHVDHEKSFKPGVIFQSGLNSKIKIENFKSVFLVDGISLYDEGRNSLVSASMFNQIKTLLQLERSKASEISEVAAKVQEQKKVKQAEEQKEQDKKAVKGNGFLISSNDQSILSRFVFTITFVIFNVLI